MIYDNMRTTLYNITNELKNNDLNIYGIKTDAIYFEYKFNNNEKIDKILNKYGKIEDEYEYKKNNNIYFKNQVRDNIGKLKYMRFIPENDTIHIFDCLKNIIKNKFEDYTFEIINKEIKIIDEYKINEIENKTIILAEVPGAGKSYACKKYLDNNKYNGLFVINNNNLANEIKKEGYNSCTPYQLLGINIYCEHNENNTENNKPERKKGLDIKEFDVIIFEEIYFNEFRLLHKLYEFMLNNKDKIFLSNGDPNQLECC
jgi:hypothetical protein